MTTASSLPCYEHRRGDIRPLHGYLRLDLSDGSWDWGARGQGDGVPSREWHGHLISYHVPSSITSKGLDFVVSDEDVISCVARVVAGYENVWDGHNYVAELADDARDAESELDRRIEALVEMMSPENGLLANVWDVDDWLASGSFKIDASTTDDQIRAMADEIIFDAAGEGIYLDGDVEQYLRDLRSNKEE